MDDRNYQREQQKWQVLDVEVFSVENLLYMLRYDFGTLGIRDGRHVSHNRGIPEVSVTCAQVRRTGLGVLDSSSESATGDHGLSRITSKSLRQLAPSSSDASQWPSIRAGVTVAMKR